MWVLWPPHVTDLRGDLALYQPLVIKVVYGDFSLLVTGDSIPRDLHKMIDSGMPIQSILLQLASSKDTFTYDEWTARVNPQLAIIHGDMGLRGTTSTTHESSQPTGTELLEADLVGRTHIYTDGQKWWLETSVNQYRAENRR
jgi:competence protein ComEC